MATGFVNTVETDYVSALYNRYPRAYVGKTETILPQQVIKCFSSIETWRGTGIGDGIKETLRDALVLAQARHRQYCEDNLAEGELRELAIRTGETTVAFTTALFAHLDDEITMLTALGVASDKVMLLCTHQLLQVPQETFKFR